MFRLLILYTRTFYSINSNWEVLIRELEEIFKLNISVIRDNYGNVSMCHIEHFEFFFQINTR